MSSVLRPCYTGRRACKLGGSLWEQKYCQPTPSVPITGLLCNDLRADAGHRCHPHRRMHANVQLHPLLSAPVGSAGHSLQWPNNTSSGSRRAVDVLLMSCGYSARCHVSLSQHSKVNTKAGRRKSRCREKSALQPARHMHHGRAG